MRQTNSFRKSSLHDRNAQHIEVQRLFMRAYLQSKLARILGDPQSPLDLDQICRWMALRGKQSFGIASVNLNYVVGVKGICNEFDREFRPKEMKADFIINWVELGVDIYQGIGIPTLYLYKFGQAYFALQHSERIIVSILRALGFKTVQADVVGPETAEVPPPTIEYLEVWDREAEKA